MNFRPTLKKILHFVKPHIFFLICSLLCAIISTIALLYAPIVIGNAVDYIIGKDDVDFTKLLSYILILLGVVATYAIFQWLMGLSTNALAYRTVKDIRIVAFKKIQRVPLKYIDSSSQGDIIAKMVGDVEQISTGLLQGFTQLFTGVITIIGTIIFMLQKNVLLAIIVIIVTPLSLFVASFIASRTHKMFQETSKINGQLSGHIEEMVTNQKVIKAFSYESSSIKEFDKINQELLKVGFKGQFYSALTNPSTRFVNALVYALVGVIGAILVVNDMQNVGGAIFTVGSLYTFLSYATQYTKPFNEISGVVTELQTAFASASRIISIIELESEQDLLLDTKEVNVSGNVKLEHVYFSYDKEKKLIEDFNLSVSKGKRVAIVGPTGCGKTTIINLLMRFYDIDEGQITIDNIDINSLKRSVVRSSYGMVLQDTWLFTGTIKENIAYARPNASLEEVISAAKKAHIHNAITQMEAGYDTVISDQTALSEGQRQLLCIARLMLDLPPMLILDEATSSIDTLTEIKIQNSFASMMVGRTTFIIAHRLSTIKNADIILVMKDGKVIETGTHNELLANKGFYYQLFNSQFAN